MAGLIGTGTNLRRQAQEGLTAVANLENQRNMQQDSLDAAAKAQEMQLYGTGMGIGGAYGVNKALAASTAPKIGAVSSMPVSGDAVLSGGELFVNQSPAVPQGVNAALTNAANPAATGALASPVGATGAVSTGTGAVTGSATGAAGTTSGALSGATGAVGSTAPVAAGSSGAMATIGTIAAPIAIGLGAAFLLNKLFG